MHSGDLPGNPYAGVHSEYFGGSRANTEQVVGAINALAFEQRTANLIAYANSHDYEDVHVVWDEIRERMEIQP